MVASCLPFCPVSQAPSRFSSLDVIGQEDASVSRIEQLSPVLAVAVLLVTACGETLTVSRRQGLRPLQRLYQARYAHPATS